MLYKKFLNSINCFTALEQTKILEAYEFARSKHGKQKRRSGGPYIHHPLRVATNLAKDGYSTDMVIAGLLHDTIEDTDTTIEELAKTFNPHIAEIVDGVSTVSKIKIKDKAKIFSDDEFYLKQVDNYRKLLLATTKNPQTMVVKLYDRLDNVATLNHIPEFKRKFYARETIEIFASIAVRLGMGMVKGALEDLSFPYAYPEEYLSFKKIIRNAYKNPQRLIQKVKPEIEASLEENYIEIIDIAARAKHYYSLYQKIKRKGNIKTIFDIIALRIIVKDTTSCYEVLGILHTLYEPLHGKIKDYIAKPKTNGYQSLHTTLKDKNGDIFEVQIRTPQMHQNAEYGDASHWNYKENSPANKKNQRNTRKWIEELEKIKNIDSKEEFLGQFKNELFSDQIFVFTPKGDIVSLPNGSTGLDFAFRIHSKLGERCNGIKINGRIATIDAILKTNDTVEVITSPKAMPKRDWLDLVHTTSARQHIRNSLRKNDFGRLLDRGIKKFNEILAKFHQPILRRDTIGKIPVSQEIPYKSVEDAIVAVGEGGLSKTKLFKIIHPEIETREQRKPSRKPQDEAETIASLQGIRHEYAKCCKPTAKDNVIGYVSRDHIIKVHKKSCKRLANIDPRRLIELK